MTGIVLRYILGTTKPITVAIFREIIASIRSIEVKIVTCPRSASKNVKPRCIRIFTSIIRIIRIGHAQTTYPLPNIACHIVNTVNTLSVRITANRCGITHTIGITLNIIGFGTINQIGRAHV